jgi:hypothetical protein
VLGILWHPKLWTPKAAMNRAHSKRFAMKSSAMLFRASVWSAALQRSFPACSTVIWRMDAQSGDESRALQALCDEVRGSAMSHQRLECCASAQLSGMFDRFPAHGCSKNRMSNRFLNHFAPPVMKVKYPVRLLLFQKEHFRRFFTEFGFHFEHGRIIARVYNGGRGVELVLEHPFALFVCGNYPRCAESGGFI